jgi:hypothetical protein
VDGDNIPEVLIATDAPYDALIEIWKMAANNTFTRIWRNNTKPTGDVMQCVDAVDIDSDGQLEIIGGTARVLTSSTGDFLFVYNYASNTVEWQSPQLSTLNTPVDDVRYGNIDNDAALEIIAVSRDKEIHVFDGITKVKEATISGTYTAIDIQGKTIYASDNIGYLDTYTSTAATFARTAHTLISAGRIDGFTLESTSPLKMWFSQGGVQKLYENGAVQSSSSYYGAPMGARYRDGVTAGRMSVVSFRLPAPQMNSEPVQNDSRTTNSVSWLPVYQADEYWVEVDTDPNFSNPQSSGWISSTNYEFSPLGGLTTYYYRVKSRRTVSPTAESAWSYSVFSTQALPVQLSRLHFD